MCRFADRRCGATRFIVAPVVFGAIFWVGGTEALPFAIGAALLCLFPYLVIVPLILPLFLITVLVAPFRNLYFRVLGRRWLRKLDLLDQAEADEEELDAHFKAVPDLGQDDLAERARQADRPSRRRLVGLLTDREALLEFARDSSDPLAAVAWGRLVPVSDEVPLKRKIDAWAEAFAASDGGADEAVFLAVPEALPPPSRCDITKPRQED